MLLVVFLFGILAGTTTVLFGFGGGFVVVPLVYHVAALNGQAEGERMHIAVATSTAVMIVTSLYATFRSHRAGLLVKEAVLPLGWFIAIGAVAGVVLTMSISDRVVRYLFIAYMVVTIADCLFRRGFFDGNRLRRAFSRTTLVGGGTTIGVIATVLGVGGSVMTVPLLRRHGYEMRYCASSANPLSIPVAVVGALLYAVLGEGKSLGAGYVGYINLPMFALLVAGGGLGIMGANRFMPRIDDAVHARVYVLLLCLVLVAIVL